MKQIKQGYYTYQQAKEILGECSLSKVNIPREVYGTLNYGHFKTYGCKVVDDYRKIWLSMSGEFWVFAVE